jgi:hypothetical protein
MLRLFVLRVAIAVWKTSIDLSKKLRPRSWIILAALNAAISMTAIYAYNAKSVDSAIPPIGHVELKPVPLPDSSSVLTLTLSSPGTRVNSGSALNLKWSASSPGAPLLVRRLEGNALKFGPTVALAVSSTSHSHMRWRTNGSNFNPKWFIYLFRNRPQLSELPRELPDWPERTWPTVVQVPEPKAPDLLTYFEKRVALAVSVITAILSIVNLLLACQALRTFKAERELKNLQITHLRLEVEKLRQEIEEAKPKKEKSTGIILVS